MGSGQQDSRPFLPGVDPQAKQATEVHYILLPDIVDHQDQFPVSERLKMKGSVLHHLG